MYCVATMKTNNPVIIGSALLANVAISAAKPLVSVACAISTAVMATAYATMSFVPVAVAAILWLLRTLISDGGKVDKPTKLAIALTVVAFGAMLAPAVTAGVVLVVVFAVVSKP